MRLWTWSIAGACALSGCFAPEIRDGQIACEIDTACPEGFVCIEGLCRNTAPSGKEDDPVGELPDSDDEPTEETGPWIYTFTGDAVTRRPAVEVIGGSDVDLAAVQLGFALCDESRSLRCWADTAELACDVDGNVADTSLADLDLRLGLLRPTFGAAMEVASGVWDYYFHRGPVWQAYQGGALTADLDADLVGFADSELGDPDLDTIYDGAPGAPASFARITFDYLDTTASKQPWYFVEADGRRFVVDNQGGTSSDLDPHFALDGAPEVGKVRAALMCRGELQLYVVD